MSSRRRRSGGKKQGLQAQKRQRQQRMALMIGGAVAVLAIGLFLFDRFRPLDVPIPDDYDTKYVEIEQGTSPDGYPQLGNPNAPIEVREYSSFTCEACLAFHTSIVDQLVRTHVKTGQVKIVFIPVDSIPDGTPARITAEAGYCAEEQGMFWEMHDVMFHWQELVGANKRRLNAAAEEIGMDGDKFSDCMGDGDTGRQVDAGMNDFRGNGLNSTPSVYVNGERIDDWSNLVARIDGMVTN